MLASLIFAWIRNPQIAKLFQKLLTEVTGSESMPCIFFFSLRIINDKKDHEKFWKCSDVHSPMTFWTGKKKLLSHCHCLLSFSHHPPISAVYVEDTSSRTTYTASIYTKSGMKVGWMPPFLESIFVNNLGQSRINLLEHGEEYLMMLPSAAVESVLRLVFRCEAFLQPTSSSTPTFFPSSFHPLYVSPQHVLYAT